MTLRKTAITLTAVVAALTFTGSCAITEKLTSRTAISTAIGCGAGLAIGVAIDEHARRKESAERRTIEGRVRSIFEQRKRHNQGKIVGLGVGCLAGLGVGMYLDLMHDDMEDTLGKRGIELEKVAGADGDTKELLVKMDGDISFDTGSSSLTGVAKQNAESVAEALAGYPETMLIIHGHSDATGSRAINDRLSNERATSVRDTLTANGVPAGRVREVRGFADTRPLPGTNTRGADQRNRRVELRISADG